MLWNVYVSCHFVCSGSIIARFNLFFLDGSPVDNQLLQSTLLHYLQTFNCQVNGPDCTVGDLLVVNMSASYAGGEALTACLLESGCYAYRLSYSVFLSQNIFHCLVNVY